MQTTLMPMPRARTIDRDLVHRRSVAEVFITDMTPAAGEVVVEAQWPRSNRFHLARAGTHYDELLVIETFRQASIAAAHWCDGVSRQTRFVMASTSFEFVPGALLVSEHPGEVTFVMRRHTLGPRRGEVDAEIRLDGVPAARARGELLMLAPAAYQRLRGGRPPRIPGPSPLSRVEPGAVGRAFAEDVVIDQSAAGTVMRVDGRHPVHFDHPQDHVPGMMLIDAARQAALLTVPNAQVSGLAADFTHFVELDEVCVIIVSTASAGHHSHLVTVDFIQGMQVKATVRCRMQVP